MIIETPVLSTVSPPLHRVLVTYVRLCLCQVFSVYIYSEEGLGTTINNFN